MEKFKDKNTNEYSSTNLADPKSDFIQDSDNYSGIHIEPTPISELKYIWNQKFEKLFGKLQINETTIAILEGLACPLKESKILEEIAGFELGIQQVKEDKRGLRY